VPIPVDNVLDRVTGNEAAITDYIFVEWMAKGLQCKREINEKTLIEID